jgi:hypothetical protein
MPEDRFRSPFLFAMTFAELMPREHLGRLLDDHIAVAETKLSQLEDACVCADTGEAFVCDFGRTMYATMLQYLRQRRSEFQTTALKAAE